MQFQVTFSYLLQISIHRVSSPQLGFNEADQFNTYLFRQKAKYVCMKWSLDANGS
jgi:hypothetical protein